MWEEWATLHPGGQEELQALADSLMMEDIAREQKLEAEIREAEVEIKKFVPIVNREGDAEKEENSTRDESPVEENGTLDLTPLT